MVKGVIAVFGLALDGLSQMSGDGFHTRFHVREICKRLWPPESDELD